MAKERPIKDHPLFVLLEEIKARESDKSMWIAEATTLMHLVVDNRASIDQTKADEMMRALIVRSREF